MDREDQRRAVRRPSGLEPKKLAVAIATALAIPAIGLHTANAQQPAAQAQGQPEEITVTVMNDLTGNGRTSDDIPLQGWTVYLWVEGVIGEAMQTDSNGQFTWSDLGPGDYRVSELLPSGWTALNSTQKELGRVASGSTNNVTFMNFENVEITVTKMRDLTGDGLTSDDTPIQNWTVYLWKDGVQGAAMLTGADGTFTWSGLGPGTYKVSELLPSGWTAKNVTEHDFGGAVGGESYNFTFANYENPSTGLGDLTLVLIGVVVIAVVLAAAILLMRRRS